MDPTYLLGTREPEIYGHETLSDIELNLTAIAKEHDAELVCTNQMRNMN